MLKALGRPNAAGCLLAVPVDALCCWCDCCACAAAKPLPEPRDVLIRHAGRCRMQGGAVGIGRAGRGRRECRHRRKGGRCKFCCCCCWAVICWFSPSPLPRPGGLIRKCVPQETGIGTRTGCHVKWKPHAKSSPGFCNTKTGARCRQQPAYKNRQAAIWKHLRARQRPAKISDIGKPNVPKHSNPEHYGSGFTLDESPSISGTGRCSGPCSCDQPRPFPPIVCRSLIPRRSER